MTGPAFALALVVLGALAWDAWRRWLGRSHAVDEATRAKVVELEGDVKRVRADIERIELRQMGRR